MTDCFEELFLWQITTYPLFKLSICDLKSPDARFFFILFDLVFLCFFVFGKEKHKSEAKLYI